MITSAKYVYYIIETLNVLRQEIISKTPLGLTDENIFFENFICELLNQCYGYQLMNLNKDKANFPGIDLGNSKTGLGIQITSTKTSAKVNAIIKITDNTKRVFDTYKALKIFVITSKQDCYSLTPFDTSKITFNWEKDILDFDDIYKASMYLSIEKQKLLADYVHQQAPFVSEQLGIDYYNPSFLKRVIHIFEKDKWEVTDNGARYVIEHNFGYLPQVSIFDLENRLVITDWAPDEKYVVVEIGSPSFEGKALLS